MELPGYSDLRPVGAGEFDERYWAVDVASNQAVLIRTLRGNAADERLQRRLQREVDASARIGPHPAIVGVQASGTSPDGVVYLVSEWCGGGALHELLSAHGPLPPHVALRMGTELADGLAAAHEAGVLHRDLTDASVQFTDDGHAKLTGFGVSSLDGGQATAALSFTPVHTAPEVIEGKEPDEATDVYQLASVIYTAIAGTPPFGSKEEGTATVLGRILTTTAAPLEHPDLPAGLNEILATAMSRAREDRYGSARQFAEALAGAAQGSSPAPAPAPPPAADTPPPPAPAPPPAADTPPPPAPA
ncbi:MAG: serine/threonine protein kinase, partial [Acidimicrobiia bacterium]|nr:serine/threonine protein kinase [Acidimicrobiia bacterium]